MKECRIAAGFNVFLEHLLSYEKPEEKGLASRAPVIQLGGGAYNILKTLHALGVEESQTRLLLLTEREQSAQGTAIEFLLAREKFLHATIPVLDRSFTSYYLLPRKGKTWAFGDRRVALSAPSEEAERAILQAGEDADLKIATEVLDEDAAVNAAVALLRSHRPEQRSVLVPSKELLRSKRLALLFPHVSLLSCNREEAKLLLAQINEASLLAHPVPTILVTDGPHTALLKTGGKVYRASPERTQHPRYVGGAGDATTAALAQELFLKGTAPEEALRKALDVGRTVLFHPTPYLPRA